MIRIINALCLPGKEINEDRIWYNDDSAIVLDGATSLVKTEYDARWFTERFVENFKEYSVDSDKLSEIINNSISSVRTEFEGLIEGTGYDYNSDIFPSATGSFVLVRDDMVQVLNIGDSTIKVFLNNGCMDVLHSHDVKMLDGKVVHEAEKIREKSGDSISEIMQQPEIRKMLIAHRRLMNTPEGYKILSINMEAVNEGEVSYYKAGDIAYIIMHTDGFDLVSDKLMQCDCDLENEYTLLRSIEDDDPNLNKIPRLKKSDDAAALILEVK